MGLSRGSQVARSLSLIPIALGLNWYTCRRLAQIGFLKVHSWSAAATALSGYDTRVAQPASAELSGGFQWGSIPAVLSLSKAEIRWQRNANAEYGAVKVA